MPAYGTYIKEMFDRCLDLYLAPRVRKMRLNIDPDSLLPSLPDPKGSTSIRRALLTLTHCSPLTPQQQR